MEFSFGEEFDDGIGSFFLKTLMNSGPLIFSCRRITMWT